MLQSFNFPMMTIYIIRLVVPAFRSNHGLTREALQRGIRGRLIRDTIAQGVLLPAEVSEASEQDRALWILEERARRLEEHQEHLVGKSSFDRIRDHKLKHIASTEEMRKLIGFLYISEYLDQIFTTIIRQQRHLSPHLRSNALLSLIATGKQLWTWASYWHSSRTGRTSTSSSESE